MIWRDLLFLKFKRDAKSLISAFVHSRTCITIAVLPTLLGFFVFFFPPLHFFERCNFCYGLELFGEGLQTFSFLSKFSLTCGGGWAGLVCLSVLFAESQHGSLLPPFHSPVLLFSKQELGKKVEKWKKPWAALCPTNTTPVSTGSSLLAFFPPHNISQKLVWIHHKSFSSLEGASEASRQTATALLVHAPTYNTNFHV